VLPMAELGVSTDSENDLRDSSDSIGSTNLLQFEFSLALERNTDSITHSSMFTLQNIRFEVLRPSWLEVRARSRV
jgi:hypothetical protein